MWSAMLRDARLRALPHDEIIDASPLAQEMAHALVANPEFYNLPRKFKMSATGCPVLVQLCLCTCTSSVGIAWQQDRAGALVDVTLANKYGWRIGDRITLQGTIFEVNPELTIRAIYQRNPPQNALYFNTKYLEEAVPWFKGQAGWYSTQIGSSGDVARVSGEIDDMFRNSPLQTKTESEKAFQLGFVASLGNVKAFILGICGAVVFTIMLVSANTMAMSVRSRTREVAVLKTIGFTRQRVLSILSANR